MEFTVSTAPGDYTLSASVRRIGEDWLVAIWGGERPHIGAVGMAQPRPSLKNSDQRSATASVFCYVGHKEDEVVKAVSEALAVRLNARVVVTAGMHWDQLSADGVTQVRGRVAELLALIKAGIDANEKEQGINDA
jgi:hypothetical protein